jgi:hypothetical protein
VISPMLIGRNGLEVWHSPPGTGLQLNDGAVHLFENFGGSWTRTFDEDLPADHRLFYARPSEGGLELLTFHGVDRLSLLVGRNSVTCRLSEVGFIRSKVLDSRLSIGCALFGFIWILGNEDLRLEVTVLYGSGFRPLQGHFEGLYVIVGEQDPVNLSLAFFDRSGHALVHQIEVPFRPSDDGSFNSWIFAGHNDKEVVLISASLGSPMFHPPATAIRLASMQLSSGSWSYQDVQLRHPLTRVGRLPGDVPEIGAAIRDNGVAVVTDTELFVSDGSIHTSGSFLPHTLRARGPEFGVIEAAYPASDYRRHETSFPSEYLARPKFLPTS